MTATLLVAACIQTKVETVRLDTVPGQPLVVASDLDNKPFAWVDSQGQPQGRDVRMMEAIGARLDRPIEWRRMEFAKLLPAAQHGEVDVVCATLGVTPERAELVDFTRPYFVTELAVVTADGPNAPTSLAQLAGRRVAAGAGTTSERAVRQQLPAAHGIFENETGAAAPQRLKSGEVDAVVMDGPAADALVKANPGLRRLPQSLGDERYALVLRRGSELRTRLDDALAQMESDGAMRRLDAEFGLAGVARAAP
jgi:ABC-type amino acid transport substrate-binding protein